MNIFNSGANRLVAQDDIHSEHQVALINGKWGRLAGLGFGTKRNASACGLNHGDVVCPVAHGDRLGQGKAELVRP